MDRKVNGENEIITNRFQVLCDHVIPWLLGGVKVKPVLLHGDLWGGNAATRTDKDGNINPMIFDACVYYGYNEYIDHTDPDDSIANSVYKIGTRKLASG